LVDTYLARQAIFDRSLNVFGYEIFCRSGIENAFPAVDGDQATEQVIESSLNTFGLGSLTLGKKTFVNVTRRMLTQDYAALLPPKQTVLEVQDSVVQDVETVASCTRLKKAGYLLALDAYRLARAGDPLVPLADILKVDFTQVPVEEQREIVRRHTRPGVSILAAKVEHRRELTEAMDAGFQLYQGYFFCRPEMTSRRDIPAYKLNYLRFLREVNRDDCNFDELDRIIRQDVSLSLKLLRYINSAMFSLKSRVESIKQALTLVGLALMKRWVTLLALAAMGDDRPGELIVISLVRARFCEQIGLLAGLQKNSFELFMIGMLSSIDAILDRPMPEVLQDLPLSEEVRQALLGNTTGLGRILGLALAYERAEWDRLPVLMDRLKLDIMKIPVVYRESVSWADQIFKIVSSV
jgi:c-di-GMP-related signal transduction protein